MPRDERAYLLDIIEACQAINDAVAGFDFSCYENSRLVRSAVEREFIVIGEAMAALSRFAPETFDLITRGRRIVDFRNQLTHEYHTVDDAIVWAVIKNYVPLLGRESKERLVRLEEAT
ncbi:MAG TPA: DUF86 domain-containing protein [bacterium]|nr:DUF86 domain-containing protein [bacterium]